MKKKIYLLFITLILILCSTGCKKDTMEDITIYTTTYPIEYITKKLYSDYSDISSIYPNEVIELSDKLIKDYSYGNLFVYNGLSNEKVEKVAKHIANKNSQSSIIEILRYKGANPKDNVVREVTMNRVLTGVGYSLDYLKELCSQEKFTKQHRVIGF